MYLISLLLTKDKKGLEKFEAYLFETINSYSFNVQKLVHISTLKVVREKIRENYSDAIFEKFQYDQILEKMFLSEFIVSKNILRDLSKEQSFIKNIFYNFNGALNYYTKLSLESKSNNCIESFGVDVAYAPLFIPKIKAQN